MNGCNGNDYIGQYSSKRVDNNSGVCGKIELVTHNK